MTRINILPYILSVILTTFGEEGSVNVSNTLLKFTLSDLLLVRVKLSSSKQVAPKGSTKPLFIFSLRYSRYAQNDKMIEEKKNKSASSASSASEK